MRPIGLECFLQAWNGFDSVGIPLYRVGILYRELEFFLQGRSAFDTVGIPLYTVGMHSTGLECFRQCWKSFVHG
jgi:hypothetical protein